MHTEIAESSDSSARCPERAAKHRAVKIALIVAVSIVATFGCLMAGCASPNSASSKGQTSSDEAKTNTGELVTATTVNNFENNDSGLYPDTYTNTTLLNIGNRGCNSCHEDLWDLADNHPGYAHAIAHHGYGKVGTYNDCECCHRRHNHHAGPYFGDLLHAAHYSSEVFVDEDKGNCWSCHAVDSKGTTGQWQFLIWDDYVTSEDVGGFVNSASEAGTRNWVKSRGFSGGFITSISADTAPSYSIDFDQDAMSNPDDLYCTNNWGPDLVDFDKLCSKDNTITITGLKNGTITLTYDQLAAMPQTNFTSIHSCVVDGLGGSLVGNVPGSGVSLQYVVDTLGGGLADGANMIEAKASDGWDSKFPSDVYLDGGVIALKYFGADLTQNQGAPFVLTAPGMPAAQWVKHVTTIDFTHSDNPQNVRKQQYAADPYEANNINGFWFNNNGITVKAGEQSTLQGAAWTWDKVVGDLDTVSFSFDGGATWKDYKAADVVNNFDGKQWLHFNVNWTPKDSGTYILKMKVKDTNGDTSHDAIGLIVEVV